MKINVKQNVTQSKNLKNLGNNARISNSSSINKIGNLSNNYPNNSSNYHSTLSTNYSSGPRGGNSSSPNNYSSGTSDNSFAKSCRNILRKGQKVSIKQLAEDFTDLTFIVKWETTSKNLDIDASCFLCGDNKKVLGDDYFIFYGNTKSKDNAIILKDSSNNESIDSMQAIDINLSMLENRVKRLVFTLTIDEAKSKGFTFNQVKQIGLQVINKKSNTSILQYNLDQINTATSISMCEIYLHNGEWKFCPMGEGLNNTDLEDLCKFYGLEVI